MILKKLLELETENDNLIFDESRFEDETKWPMNQVHAQANKLIADLQQFIDDGYLDFKSPKYTTTDQKRLLEKQFNNLFKILENTGEHFHRTICGLIGGYCEDRFTLQEIKPDRIIHLAAMTGVDLCETEKELATLINTKATEILARQAVKLNAFFLYVSTDYVFDGEKLEAYIESDTKYMLESVKDFDNILFKNHPAVDIKRFGELSKKYNCI